MSLLCFIVMAAFCLWVCVFRVCRPTINPVFAVTPQQLMSKALLLNACVCPPGCIQRCWNSYLWCWWRFQLWRSHKCLLTPHTHPHNGPQHETTHTFSHISYSMTSCHVTWVTLSNATLMPWSGTPDMRLTARKGPYERLNHQRDMTEIRVKTKNTAILRGSGAFVLATQIN